MISSTILSRIRETALQASATDEIMISQDGNVFLQPPEVQQSSLISRSFYSLFQRAHSSPDPLQPTFTRLDGRLENLSATISILKQIFGALRLDRCFSLLSQAANGKNFAKKMFSRENFAALLFSLALVTKEDFEELLEEIKSPAPIVRNLSLEALQAMRLRFSGKTMQTCTSEDLDYLESILLPFTSIKDIFWQDASHTQTDVNAPPTFSAMLEKAAWGRYLLQSKLVTQEEWEHIFAKVFSPPFLPKHCVLPQKTGYMYLTHTIEGGGASLRFFTPLGASPTNPTILARSTRGLMPTDSFSDAMVSLAENLRKNLGSFGCIATFDKIKALLNNPSLGFVRSTEEKIQVLGYSQGGVHAQNITVAFPTRVKRLTTVSSPGTDKETAALFRKIVEKEKTPITIVHLMDMGDIISLSGEEHLWAEKNVELMVQSFAPAYCEAEDFSLKNALKIAFDLRHIHQTIKKFSQAHSRLTPADPFKERTLLMNHKQTFTLCQHDPSIIDPSWEWIRKFLAWVPSYDFAGFVMQQQCLNS